MTDSRGHDSRLHDACKSLDSGAIEIALHAFGELANSGERRANLYLGWIYDQGLSDEGRNIVKAESHYQVLADDGDMDGAYYLGILYFRNGKCLESIGWLECAAKQGHPSAAYWLYRIFMGDEADCVVEIDAAKSQSFLITAAKLGHIYAIRDLARTDLNKCKGMLKLVALTRYIWLRLKAIYLILKNSNDPRVR